MWIAIGIVIGLLLLFFIFLFVVYWVGSHSPKKGQNNDFSLTSVTLRYASLETVYDLINTLLRVPYRDVYIKSFDGVRLHAREYLNTSSDTVCIMFHGYRGTACRDFSGGCKDMIDRGYNVILVDQRAHGLSKGHSITFGVKEKKDAKCWIEYAKKTFGEDKRIVLVGISMGGATVLLASDLLKEGDKVIADCPYSAPKEILSETMKNSAPISPKIMFPIANLASIIFAHVALGKDDANEHVKRSKAKILIIHGDTDSIVPHKYSLRVYENNKDKVRYELFEGAEHGISYIADKPRYQRIVNEFLNE